jgi:uncharacterized protein YkwD
VGRPERLGRLAVAVLAAALAATAGRPCAAAEALEPTPDERKETTDLIAQFRKAKDDAEARTKAVDRILELGGPAPAKLLDAVNADIRPLHPRYRQAFLDEAAKALAEKVRGTVAQDVETARATILGLVRRDNLAKDAIAKDADPALRKLEEALRIDPASLLKQSPALQKQHDDLMALVPHWQRLSDYMVKHPDPKAPDAAKPVDLKAVLAAEEQLATLLVLAKDDPGRWTILDNVPLEAKLDPEEAAGLRELNRLLLLLGASPVRIDTALCEAARDHCKDMATLGFFGHDSPVPGKATHWDRAKRAGTSANAENINAGVDTGAGAIASWWHSPGHFKNMLSPHRRAGLGRHGNLWTLMLGG